MAKRKTTPKKKVATPPKEAPPAPQDSPAAPEEPKVEVDPEFLAKIEREVARLEVALGEAEKRNQDLQKDNVRQEAEIEKADLRDRVTGQIQDREDRLMENPPDKAALQAEVEELKAARAEGYKPILCLGFDGVVHESRQPWRGPAEIPDRPVAGFFPWVREALDHFEVHIFSARSNYPGGIAAMKKWLAKWAVDLHDRGEDLAWLNEIKWPTKKPPAHVSLDDRAITFKGDWPSITILRAFKPWNKRSTL